jgi:hypothetical protein
MDAGFEVLTCFAAAQYHRNALRRNGQGIRSFDRNAFLVSDIYAQTWMLPTKKAHP